MTSWRTPDPMLAPTASSIATERSARCSTTQAVLRVATAGLVDHLALRSVAIDEAVGASIGSGVRQLVILGAGLDARAYRLEGLAETTVFEVDHPASQAYKRERTRTHAARARDVVHVSVDFSRETTSERLAACGHDRTRPTAWICEGVTMYLQPEATLALLDQVEVDSAAGSVLALTYLSAGEAPLPEPLMRVVHASMHAVGEPFRQPIAPRAMASWLDQRGFRVESDTSSRDWAPRFGGSRAMGRMFRSERLVVASKR